MANNKTYTEYKFLTVVDRKFGRDLLSRMEKLNEEVSELFEAYGDAYQSFSEETKLTDNPELLDHLRDEVADTFAVITHIADILGMNQRDMFERVLDKLKQRETDPEYKKQKSIVN